MIAAHFAAAKALLTGLTVYEDSAPDEKGRSYPFVVLRTAFRDEDAPTVLGVHDSWTFRVSATSVGKNGTSARVVSGAVATKLRDVRPAVTGRVCGPIHLSATSGEPMPDLDVTLPGSAGHPVYVTDVWEWQSDPA